jgi:hypothetical protein
MPFSASHIWHTITANLTISPSLDLFAVISSEDLMTARWSRSVIRSFRSHFLERSNDCEMVTLGVTVWHLWKAWNGVRNGEKRKHPKSLAEQIKAYIELILLHLAKIPTIHRRETPSTSSQWSPLPAGRMAINVDATLFYSLTKIGVGVVIRAH